jgi:peptidoglycan hydrolase-like protein with peptidoglycan-binding domain
MGTNMTGRATSFFADWAHENTTRPAPKPERQRRQRRRSVAAIGVLAVAAATAALLPTTVASADPSANTWYRLRMCESSNNYATNTGNDHYGAYQFDLPTWRSVGGTGYPNRASKAEQDKRALILYRERGWQPWQCASILGLREDSDARSGRTNDIVFPTSTSSGSSGSSSSSSGSSGSSGSSAKIPAFPGGSHWYTYGETNRNIKVLQDQMHKRGYFPVGTGQYGPNTLRMVKQLQRLNGLVPNGYIGPNTWRLAWTGKYSKP